MAGWPTYGGDPGGTRYSPLTQITPENVHALEVAWTFRTGDLPGAPGVPPQVEKTAFQATPVLDEGLLYFCTPTNKVFALDAATGALRWRADARPEIRTSWTATCRGVALWRDAEAGAGADADAPGCRRRVFMGTMDARLVALDAATGRPCPGFGTGGAVDLTRGLGPVEDGDYYVTSPPTVAGDVVAVGALVADGRRLDMPGGVVRGFDARTGALRWAFDPAPPGTPPLPPGPDGPRFHRGTPNAWSIFSADPERGLLFVPTGNPSVDFFRGTIREGVDHYGSSVVALDAATGRVVWHFQTVRHDLWDYDVAAQPTLLEVLRDGRRIPAVAQATKMGHLFLLHRETGAPLFAVEERPAPASDVPGERTAPTQPVPTFPPPLHPHRLTPEEAWGLTPWDRGRCRERIAALRNEGIFTPPSLAGSLLYPGTAGGNNWGGVAWDPERRLLVLNQSRIAQALTLVPQDEVDAGLLAEAAGSTVVGFMRQEGTPYALRNEVLVSPLGIPCSPPPWGTLLAVDLARGQVRWEVPLGTTRDMTPLPFGLALGMPSLGGPIATASGLVFIGAAMDDYLRAFDVETGEELWRGRLPAGGQATPMTYRLRPDGRQYVVIAAGGHATLGTDPGDWVVAYALPRKARSRPTPEPSGREQAAASPPAPRRGP